MKFSSQEEYGLRCLMRLGKDYYTLKNGLTIPEISQAEGISQHVTAKILRLLRLGGFVESVRGSQGGYSLSRAPENIILGDVFNALGGRLFDESFCENHSGDNNICTNSFDCSIKSVWTVIQKSVDNVVNQITLKDLFFEKQ